MDRKEVERVARLARLQVDDASKDRYAEQLAMILDHFEVIREIDTDEVPPSRSSVEFEPRLRPDVPSGRDEALRDALLDNATVTEDGSYQVPRVIE